MTDFCGGDGNILSDMKHELAIRVKASCSIHEFQHSLKEGIISGTDTNIYENKERKDMD